MTADATALSDFLNEAKILCTLEHPHIVTAYGITNDELVWYGIVWYAINDILTVYFNLSYGYQQKFYLLPNRVLYHTYHTIPYHTYHTIPYHTIPYHTTLQ